MSALDTVKVSVSYAECSARERIARLIDAGSFHEWLPPGERVTSPHLAQLGVPSSFDDGVAIGRATLAGRPVFVAAQEGEFMENIRARNVACVLEIGPGQALTRMWNEAYPDIPARSCDEFRSAGGVRKWLESLG